MTLSRRGLITGLISFVAAPAIVRAASLMPVKALPMEVCGYEFFGVKPDPELYRLLQARINEVYGITRAALTEALYGDMRSHSLNLLEHLEP